jgi:hypothetical protein
MNETRCRPRPGEVVKKESHGCALIKNNFLASSIFMACGGLSFKHTVYPKRAANSLSKPTAFAASLASVAIDAVFGCKREILRGGTLKEDPLTNDELVGRGLVEGGCRCGSSATRPVTKPARIVCSSPAAAAPARAGTELNT